MSFHKELKARWAMPAPAFFKKAQRRTAATSAAFVALTGTLATISSLVPGFPSILAMISGFTAAFFGGIAAACTMAVEDTSQLPPP